MSDETYLCEYCGHGSTSKQVCTHCGRDISAMVDQPLRFSPPAIGRLTLRVYDTARTVEAWKALAELWDWMERHTNLRVWPSQMEKFPPADTVLQLYASSHEIHTIQEKLPGLFVLEFEQLPREAIPHRPKYELPRRPRPPRNQR